MRTSSPKKLLINNHVVGFIVFYVAPPMVLFQLPVDRVGIKYPRLIISI